MKTVVFLGSKNIGYECLKHLYNNQSNLDLDLVGVLKNVRGKKFIEYCRGKSIKVIDGLDEFLEIDSCDIAISVQYHEILKKKHIEKAKEPKLAYEDIVWALINTKEFLFNH